MSKENLTDDLEDKLPEESGIIDIAKMEVQCYLVIKDSDTNEILVNKRG
jgi:hypothetical protein